MTQFLQEMDSHTITVTYIAYGDTSKQTSLQIPLTPKTEDLDPIDINMHSSPTSAFAMPSQYNDWFTACFGYPVQLIYLGPNRRSVLFKDMQPAPPSPITKFLQRIVPSTSIPYLPKLLGPHEAEPSKITFADCAPYLLCSQTSLDDVSSRLPAGTQMDMTKFRPNIVLDGALQAFQEDHWQRVAIGTNIELSLRHNCVRCKSINVDYRTGRPGEGAQGTVLKKLQGDRRVDVGARWSPVFGRYGFWGKGREGGEVVRVGDRVQVRRVDEGFSVWCVKKPRHVSALDGRGSGGPCRHHRKRTFDQPPRSRRPPPRQPVYRHVAPLHSRSIHRPHSVAAVSTTYVKPCAHRWLSPQRPGMARISTTTTPFVSRCFATKPTSKPSLPLPSPNSCPPCLFPPSSIVRFAIGGTARCHGLQQPARMFSASRLLAEAATNAKPARQRKSYKDEIKEKGIVDVEEHDGEGGGEEHGFAKSEKATQAKQVDLSAKLSKDGSGAGGTPGGMKEIWRLIKIARPELPTLSWAFLFLILGSGISLSVPFSIGKILDAATSTENNDGLLFGMTPSVFYFALAGVLTTGAAFNFSRIIILRIVGERIVARLRSQLYRKTFVQNAEFFDANRVGDLISRLGSDTIIVGKSITQNLSDGLRALVSGGAGFAMMAFVSLKLTGILVLIAPPVALVAYFSGRSLRNLSRKIQKNLGTLTKIAEERLGNVRTSQAFAGEAQEAARYNRQIKRIFALGKKEAIVAASFYGSTGLLGNLTIIAILYVGGNMVKNGVITIGELSSFLMYTVYAGSSMVGLSGFYGEMMKGVGAASRLFELQDRNPTISPTKGLPVRSARGRIEFKNCSFSYPTRPAVSIFKDLSFKIEQGTNVAIVAPSGAGKSTVASLLLRFYIPTAGTITIDGQDITTLNAKQLRRKIGYVGQEPVLFSGTIAENIAYGVPNATRAEIVAAARKANCQFISDFPDGLETHVGARGTQLSGGQKQRIAIARALIKKPDILILDEATSALDAESETLVNQALSKLLQENNTTISIAHRLSTIKRSDRIICINADGKVAEEGTYEQLSSNPGGAFNKLMEWQMSGGDVPMDVKSPKPTEEEEIELELEEAVDRNRV
ncbi:hypothetical protein BDW02DRAFT_579272 [Decorospora gaudefroyi]|uniref:P-loop containing nucleoside triphosphate hydrolase protein n=1 Tax=Decorospora gaudefroyi TaxID=184978 RepID=A0A6A5KBX2_9PLEO|nr:hypothetical protein BDW02DRAFT_579272 [Decorospora gaudefroyi]